MITTQPFNKDVQYFLNRRSLNIDIGFRCPLECPRCQRQMSHRDHGKKVPGYDLTLDEIDKISDPRSVLAQICWKCSLPS